MKTILYYITFIVLISTSAFAQDPITVTITGDCTTLTGTYDFTGLINGKNNYYAEFIIDGEDVVLQIGFDGTKWVFYTDNDLEDFGFFNVNVPNGLLPPNTGWQVEYCINGTLIIEGGVAATTNLEINNNFYIYQISTDYLKIKFDTIINSPFLKIEIYDIFGKSILRTKINNNVNQINISHLTKGIYFAKINDIVKKILIQ